MVSFDYLPPYFGYFRYLCLLLATDVLRAFIFIWTTHPVRILVRATIVHRLLLTKVCRMARFYAHSMRPCPTKHFTDVPKHPTPFSQKIWILRSQLPIRQTNYPPPSTLLNPSTKKLTSPRPAPSNTSSTLHFPLLFSSQGTSPTSHLPPFPNQSLNKGGDGGRGASVVQLGIGVVDTWTDTRTVTVSRGGR